MHKVVKKLYISILTSVLVFVTIVATTYAWVGILTYSNFDNISMNLEISDSNRTYQLLISTTGEVGSYGDSIPYMDVQKAIMDYKGIDYKSYIDQNDEVAVDTFFSNKKLSMLTPVSPNLNLETNELDNWYEMELKSKSYQLIETNKYFCFDIYLIVDPIEGIQETTSINANIFLDDIENSLSGLLCTGSKINDTFFESLPSSDPLKSLLSGIPTTFSVNSANSTRFALSIYNPIDINSNYSNSNKPLKTLIYQSGKQTPNHIKDNQYDLGGILPEEYNYALQEINELFNLQNTNLSQDAAEVYEKRKNDLELIESNNMVWQKTNELYNDRDEPIYFGVNNGIQTKIKIRVYFWFEGWDADSLRYINAEKVYFNLKFTTDKNEF